jgi:hypothetical protein
MEHANSPKLKKRDKGEEQRQEHAHNFPLRQGNCSQIILRGRPISQLRILL